MNKSETIEALASALAKAQSELKNPGFDANNPHFRSKYASLAAVRDAVIPILSKHGLSILQSPVYEDGKAGCETILMHSSGQFMSERLLIPVDKANAHGVGSAVTYSRRFSLMAFTCVVGDDDDDGNAAVGKAGVSTTKPVLQETITPTTDCWSGVPRERHELLNRIAADVMTQAKEGNLQDAYDYLYTENLDAGKVDNDEFVCIWDCLKGESKIRNTLKKMRQDRQLAGAA